MDVYSLTPSEVKECIETCMKARLVPFIQSSPGLGKSSIVKQIAKEYRLKVIDCRLSSMEPTDLNGLPWFNNGKAEFQPYEFFPTEDKAIPEGYEGWLLFLDEFNSASRATQAAAYRVILDREIGQHKLHNNCFVVAAGNKTSDNAITNRLSTAMLSRLIHFQMEPNFDDWRDNFAIPQKIDERIIAYLSMYPSKLMEFDPDKEDETFACPRTWQFASDLIKANGNDVSTKTIPLLGGAITVAQASAFVQFCKVYQDLIRVEDILKNPNINPPKDSASIWAIVVHLIQATDDKNYSAIFKFVDKLPPTFKVVYFSSIVKHHKELLMDPEFMEVVQGFTEYFMGK